MTHVMKVYFHTCQYLFTAYFRKTLSFEMHFLSNFRFQHVFQQLLKHIKEKTDLLFCFWFCNSRVIIVTYLPSFESADSEFYFTSHNNNVHALSCMFVQHRSQNYVKIFSPSLSLSLSLLADADTESFDSDNVFFNLFMSFS